MRLRTAAAACLTATTVLSTLLSASSPALAEPRAGFELAFTGWVGDDSTQSVLTVDTASGQVRTFAAGGANALTWTASGDRLLWLAPEHPDDAGATLFSARPDGSDRQEVLAGSDVRSVAASPDGTVAVVRADLPVGTDCATNPPVPRAEVLLLAPDGTRRGLGEVPVNTSGLQFSPDGSRLLWRSSAGDPCGGGADSQVFVTDLAAGTTRQVTGESQRAGWLSFAADGRTVLAAKSDGLGQDLVRLDLDTATSERLRTTGFAESLPAASPDGTRFAIVRTPGYPEYGPVFVPTGTPHVVVVDAWGRELQDLGPTPVVVDHLAWSPDGSFLALGGFTSVPACEGCDYGSADPALWTVPLDGGAPAQLTTAGGFATAGLAFRSTFPDPPVVERRARRSR
ncbi:hypothetical protein [Kineococcus sp. SYSU DK003]|uniref:hypothetical protein n=1 Tax=Kineococcus sp. SYSU DK003 TaxID=3383124 RepID=UPI003D7CF2B2